MDSEFQQASGVNVRVEVEYFQPVYMVLDSGGLDRSSLL
jgi:hypothetical protein